MSADLMKVSKGLKLVFWGLMVVVIAVVLGVIGVFAAGFLGAAAARQGGGAAAVGPGGPMLVVLVGVGVLGFAGNIVGLVGRFFCLAAPPEAQGAKARITLSVIFEVCALLNGLVMNVDNFARILPPVVKSIASGFGILMQIAAVILFLLFIKALAEFIRRRQLADDAAAVLYLVYGVLGCYLVSLTVLLGSVALGGGFGGGGGAPGGGMAVAACLGAVVGLVSLVIALIALIKYARLLTEVSDAVQSYARKVKRKRREEDEYDDDEEDEDDDPDRRFRRNRQRRRDEDEDEDEEPDDDLDDDRGTRRRRPR